ncbi:hypothetical protein MTR67_001318 [Solanum verrucosum]|uniref:CCHC-type domain-containing protein n=1 Tax=Solanum verrucosum TaxID=315347 RepID=A0AAF0PN09_SOLVR|nr:hypothetical protein MTR67_001318 [Solanum verrucosum]
MSVMEYALKFIQLAKYVATMITDSRAMMSLVDKVALDSGKRCGKKHDRKCLAGMDGCFNCGMSGHKIRNCPLLVTKGRECRQTQPSGSDLGAPKQKKFYAIQTR